MTDASKAPLPKARPRPVYRNIGFGDLTRYRLPAPGIASILHRITGVGLFVGMLIVLPLFAMSLKSDAGFEAFRSMVWGNALGKLILIALLLAVVYHLVAGVRHMIQDANRWLDLATSTRTAWATMVISVAITAIVVARVW